MPGSWRLARGGVPRLWAQKRLSTRRAVARRAIPMCLVSPAVWSLGLAPRWPTPPARLCAHGDHTVLLPKLSNAARSRTSATGRPTVTHLLCAPRGLRVLTLLLCKPPKDSPRLGLRPVSQITKCRLTLLPSRLGHSCFPLRLTTSLCGRPHCIASTEGARSTVRTLQRHFAKCPVLGSSGDHQARVQHARPQTSILGPACISASTSASTRIGLVT